MRRGTTPTIVFNLGPDIDFSSYPSVILTLQDKRRHTVNIGQEDLTFSTDEDGNHLISATLTQHDTLAFDTNSRVKCQIRAVDEDGNAFATDIVLLTSDEILLNCVIDENTPDIPQPRPVYACTVSIGTVTTLEPTEDAFITNVGTNKQAILNFGIPRGETGPQGERGETGPAGSLGSITASVDGTIGSPAVVVTYDGTNADFAFSGLKGAQGERGLQGDTGADGVSPTVETKQTSTGATIIITDATGSHTATIANGEQGIQGETGKAGADGVSPTIETEQTSTGATIIITDATGSHTATLLNGERGLQGETGKAGADGVSPTIETEQTSTGTTIIITDATGSHTATVLNGEQGIQGETGKAGADGVSPTVTTTQTSSGAIITITDASGEHTATLTNGSDYVLTSDDKTKIRDEVYALLEDADGVSY